MTNLIPAGVGIIMVITLTIMALITDLKSLPLLSLLTIIRAIKTVQSHWHLSSASSPVSSPSTVAASWWARGVRRVSEINVFMRSSVCDSCALCSRGVCYFCSTLSRLDSLQGALQGRWQMASVGRGSAPDVHTQAASMQSSTQPQGGFLGHTHLTQVAGKQVNLKHAAGAIINTCRHTLITTHVDRLYSGQDLQWYNSFWAWCDFSRPVVIKVEPKIPQGYMEGERCSNKISNTLLKLNSLFQSKERTHLLLPDVSSELTHKPKINLLKHLECCQVEHPVQILQHVCPCSSGTTDILEIILTT